MSKTGALNDRASVLLQFDQEATQALRVVALEERKSVTGFVRELVEQALTQRQQTRQTTKQPVKR